MERILTTASGRYKVLKLAQYIAKFILLQATQKRIRITLSTREKLRVLIGQCSLQRRILQLGNLYSPIKALFTGSENRTWHDLISAIAGVTEDVSEDAFTLSQLGWLPSRFASLAVYADRAWLLSVLLDLRIWVIQKHSLVRKKQRARLLDDSKQEVAKQRKLELTQEEWWLDVHGVKMMCDAGQAYCDVFDVQVFQGFDVYCALTSSVLGMYRFIGR